MALVEDIFYGRGSLKHINSTFITLILKLKGATTIHDYRPISGVNTVYKVVSKLLDDRLYINGNIRIVVAESNSLYVGRVIFDNTTLAKELI